MKVAVIVDSSSCITPEVAKAYHLRVAPLHLMWGKKEYADWVDMTPEEFHARLKTEKMENWPTSSGSVQGEFLKAFEELRGKFDGVVAVTLSPGTPSAGYQSALMAKDMAEGIPIEVVDSHRTVTATGLVATAAAQAAHAGASMEEVVKAAESVIPKTNVFFNVGSISYFLRLGRVGESEVDRREDSHILTIKENGKITPSEKYPTQKEARRRLKELVKEKARKDTPLHVGLFHAAAREEAEEFKKWIASQYNCAELWIGECSPVVAIHVSPDSLGIAFYNE
jgi:DegV family protein with EDD domain